MTIGSLFSGIGGLELGLERAGLGPVIWQAEQNDYCRRVLAKHWPDVKRYSDVREVGGDAERPDIICGGFPCQDISSAGKQAGIDGERSGLWREFARVIRALRPRFVVVENVSALLGRGFERVLRDLAESGYDAEWDCIPAAAVGAPHRRDRVFIVAYANGDRKPGGALNARARSGIVVPDSSDRGVVFGNQGWWAREPAVGRVADGVPGRVDRVRALGNAVVPQVAEVVGRRVVELMGGRNV